MAALLFGQLATAQEESSTNAPLRYGWKAGQTLVYSVTIRADRGDYFDVLKGRPSFHVKSADGDGITASFIGTLSESCEVKQGKRIFFRGPRRFSPFSPFTGVSGASIRGGNEVSINLRGGIVTSRGSSQLPFLLGNLSQLMIDRLPEADEKTWKYQREISISESSNRLPFPSFRRGRNQKLTKATEETTYTIEKSSADAVVIKKTYELKTALTVGGKPKFHIVGEGTLTFDRKVGAFSKFEYQQTITVRDGDDVRETPIQVSFQLLSEEEQKEFLAATEAARAKAAAPPTAEQREQILADLVSNQSSRFLKRLMELQRKSPRQPDEGMAAALEVYLVAEDKSHRFMAAKALENWATNKSTAALLTALDDDFNIVSGSAMKALGRLRAKEAAEPIAAKLSDQRNRVAASRALLVLGSIAEEPVLKQLKHSEWQVRYEACKILGTIGTEKSLQPLQDLADDKNALVKQTAKKAIQKVEERRDAPQA
jgi:hypothetical protein